jgi:hypothetical protein
MGRTPDTLLVTPGPDARTITKADIGDVIEGRRRDGTAIWPNSPILGSVALRRGCRPATPYQIQSLLNAGAILLEAVRVQVEWHCLLTALDLRRRQSRAGAGATEWLVARATALKVVATTKTLGTEGRLRHGDFHFANLDRGGHLL